MTTKIDKFGRILIPKPMRQRMGLLPGSPVSLVEGDGGTVQITAEHSEPLLEMQDGLLVYTGPIGEIDPVDAVHQIYEERADRHWGRS